MKNWNPLTELPNDCPWQQDYEAVRQVCSKLNIPYSTINLEKEYKERVLDKFLKEYQNGRTPNPDVLCNSEIKFDAFWTKVKSLGFEAMATGHYAKIENQELVKPKDTNKDQTYFLCNLSRDQLNRAVFPLGDLTKDEVREIAKVAGLPTADKKDSQGICFIGKLPVREFLKQSLALEKGQTVTKDGRFLGEHEGAQLYTIGQRHIGVHTQGQQLYVTGKDARTNTVVMAEEKDLYKSELKFERPNWLTDPTDKFECDIQLRYRSKLLPAIVALNGNIKLKEPARAVTPGQYAAFYKNGTLIGGAIIK